MEEIVECVKLLAGKNPPGNWGEVQMPQVADLVAEVEKAHEARREAQREVAFLKERLAASRVELRRELLQLGWVPPAPTAAAPMREDPEHG